MMQNVFKTFFSHLMLMRLHICEYMSEFPNILIGKGKSIIDLVRSYEFIANKTNFARQRFSRKTRGRCALKRLHRFGRLGPLDRVGW